MGDRSASFEPQWVREAEAWTPENIERRYKELTGEYNGVTDETFGDRELTENRIAVTLGPRESQVLVQLMDELEFDTYDALFSDLLKRRAKERGMLWDLGRFQSVIRADEIKGE